MILVLNLKMHMSLENIIKYEKLIHDYDVIVLPQYPYLPYFHNGKYSLGSQDVSKYKSGSYTGEVCAKSLKDIGCKYVLVGHSERKRYFNETMVDTKNKIINVCENNLVPIVCINQYEKNDEFNDIDAMIQYIPEYTKYVIIAYEPAWMIGSNSNIDLEYLRKAIIKIKECLIERNINHSIIYGGSVNKSNIDGIVNTNGLDGVIISTSALDREELISILKKYKSV